MNHLKYLFTLLAAALISAGAIMAFNLAVDPLGTGGLVGQKYKPIHSEQQQKYTKIILRKGYENYDRYILGSSKVLNLHLLDKPFLSDMYNFGISGGFNQQKYFIINELCRVKPPKQILLQIRIENFYEDPWMPQDELAETFIEKSSVDWKFLLSSELVSLSWKTLNNALHHKYIVYINEDGSLTYADKEDRIKKGKYDFSKRTFIATAIDWKNQDKKYSSASFREIKEAADECGVELIPFIVPEHESLFAFLMLTRPEEYIRARRDLLDIFGWYYDFCGLNDINTSTRNFHDPGHYRSDVGDMILGRILGREDMEHPGFGLKVTRDNLETHIRKLEEDARRTPYTEAVFKALKKQRERGKPAPKDAGMQ